MEKERAEGKVPSGSAVSGWWRTREGIYEASVGTTSSTCQVFMRPICTQRETESSNTTTARIRIQREKDRCIEPE